MQEKFKQYFDIKGESGGERAQKKAQQEKLEEVFEQAEVSQEDLERIIRKFNQEVPLNEKDQEIVRTVSQKAHIKPH